MSTKAIRKMMEHYQSITNVEGVPRKVQLMDVIQEVEAIERAAKVVLKDKGDEYVMQGEIDSAYGLLESIAKDAP